MRAATSLIQCAVREFVIAVIRDHCIVWGGHPAITPMIWSICEDLGVDYARSVTLYQSRFFEDRYPEENQRFQNVVFTDAVANDKEASLLRMRETMLSREDLVGAVFIGGMEGMEVEHDIFKRLHPTARILPVPAPGGAALNLAKDHGYFAGEELTDIDFARLFHTRLASGH
ncbi:hypothetical protein [Burkholderia pseudomallei]|uniref:SLOG domain-containing protein n=1 Tax=Burkholderia pseudomallei TaxID=28450 RepID=UPI0009E47A85|nr:hypothetical protein [Burkholderia pseudomallei]